MVRLPRTVHIGPPGAVRGSLRVPGSKSLTNRALIIAALADGVSELRDVLIAEDSDVLIRALTQLGVRIESSHDNLIVHGVGGAFPASEADLDLRLSGTSIRFLAAALAIGNGRYRLDGTQRMRERPIGDLLEALTELGVACHTERGNDCPPFVIEASGLPGGATSVAGDRSSQFLSALLMAAPYATAPIDITVTGDLQSKPFIDMTINLMQAFGVEVQSTGTNEYRIEPQHYRGMVLDIEGDAMAAGYFHAAAAVSGGAVTVQNIGRSTLQGDHRFPEVLREMGASVEYSENSTTVHGPKRLKLRGGTFDLNDMPDQAQTLAVLGLFTDEPVRIVNVSNMRIKETDRISAMVRELRKLGGVVEEGDDWFAVHPLERYPSSDVVFDTYGDHRMAMALAILGTRIEGVVIRDPEVVNKTYPQFFEDFLHFLGGWGA